MAARAQAARQGARLPLRDGEAVRERGRNARGRPPGRGEPDPARLPAREPLLRAHPRAQPGVPDGQLPRHRVEEVVRAQGGGQARSARWTSATARSRRCPSARCSRRRSSSCSTRSPSAWATSSTAGTPSSSSGEIHEELRKLSRAVEQSASAILITDAKGEIEYVNPQFTEMTGYAPAEVLGQNPRFLKSGEMPPEEYQELWETITAGREWRGEFHNQRKNGELYWDYSTISPILDAQGVVTHFVAVKEDITDRKEAEALQAGVLNISAEIAGCQTEDEICRVVVEGIRSRMGVDRCGLFLGNPNHPPFRGTYGTDMDGTTVRRARPPLGHRRGARRGGTVRAGGRTRRGSRSARPNAARRGRPHGHADRAPAGRRGVRRDQRRQPDHPPAGQPRPRWCTSPCWPR